MHLDIFDHRPGAGWSRPPDPALDSDRTLVLAFGPSALLDGAAPLADVSTAFPRACIVGCSTSGAIHDSRIDDDRLVVAVARFDAVRLRSAVCRVDDPAGSFGAGEHLARTLRQDDLRAVLVFSDGLLVNGSALVRGLNSVLPPSVVISGGLAGDGDRFRRTWVFDGCEPAQHRVAAVGLYGTALRVGHGSKGGWDAFGVERRVTRSTGNVLHELDGRPALEIYKEYLGERASGLPATALLFPLTLWPGDAGDDPSRRIVRTVLGVNEADQSMVFAGDLPVGHHAQMMYANFDHLVHGAGEAALAARGDEPAGDLLALAVSCVGRRLVLGDRAEEEVEAIRDVLPGKARPIGFYSYGELSPVDGGACDLHNQTMTLTTLAEG